MYDIITRMNKIVHWIAETDLMADIFSRIKDHLPLVIDGPLHDALSCRINVYKYDSGDVFNEHIGKIYHHIQQEKISPR